MSETRLDSHYVRHQLKSKLRAAKAMGRPLRRPYRILHPDPVIRQYRRDLRAVVDKLQQLVMERVVRSLPMRLEQAQQGKPSVSPRRDDGELTVQDAWTDSFTADFGWVTAQFGQAYTADQIRRMAKAAGESVSLFNQKQLDRSIGSVLELDAVASEPWLAEKLGEFVVENTNLITSLEDTALSQVQTMAMQGLTQGRRWEDIADDIYGRFDVARSRADTIARDQVGKLNGQLTELRQQNLGISQYTWRGVGDERERESHRANNDQVFDWDSPPEETGHPGDDINCRCYAEPVIESIDTEG